MVGCSTSVERSGIQAVESRHNINRCSKTFFCGPKQQRNTGGTTLCRQTLPSNHLVLNALKRDSCPEFILRCPVCSLEISKGRTFQNILRRIQADHTHPKIVAEPDFGYRPCAFQKMVLLSKNLLKFLDSSKTNISMADIDLCEHGNSSKIESSDRK